MFAPKSGNRQIGLVRGINDPSPPLGVLFGGSGLPPEGVSLPLIRMAEPIIRKAFWHASSYRQCRLSLLNISVGIDHDRFAPLGLGEHPVRQPFLNNQPESKQVPYLCKKVCYDYRLSRPGHSEQDAMLRRIDPLARGIFQTH